ncbi:hypothetical protein [Absidia glauca]|uniref:NADP-dependent oxidoreductase domain-containing protein n=1 Tax=Absidia glauca TaxID=4829 RepID=A0A168SNK3_ABSGL|nr:hypothetical protein [Absidia glauca]
MAPPMQYVYFGNTGLKVSRLCLGCMGFGSSEWMNWVLDEKASIEMIGKAYDRGINFFDTANIYSNGESERILGKAIRHFQMPRGRIVVATKVALAVQPFGFNPTPKEDPAMVNLFGTSRKHLFDAVDASLARLGLDYIDLRANAIAEKNGWTPFVSMQNLYNLIYREDEREMIPYCKSAGIAMIPWSPLAGGLLTGRVNRSTARSDQSKLMMAMNVRTREEQDNALVVDQVVNIAEKRGVSPAQVALAWCLSKSVVTAPIVGITKESHLNDLIGALELELTRDEIKALEKPYSPRWQMRSLM